VLWNRLQIDAAIFGSRYSNLIGPAAQFGTSPLTFQFQNIADARVVGSTSAPTPPSTPAG
jgi:hypothetical protein